MISKYRKQLLLVLPLILLYGILLPQGQSHAQNRVNILQADSIIGGIYQGERVQKIIGNVHLQSEELDMFCDSAYQFVNQDEIRAFGNIQINTKEEKIWADTLIYFTDIDFSQLRGRVIIEADSTTLFGNSVDYRFSTKVGHFIDRVRLEDQEGILTARSGFYYREADSAVFRGEVQLADSLKYIEGDSLFTNRSSEYYELYGDIFADDRENNTKLKGDYLEADSTGRRLLRGNAWLMNYEEGSTRTEEPVLNREPSPIAPDTTAAVTDSLRPNQPSVIRQDSLNVTPQRGGQRPDSLMASVNDSTQTETAPSDTTHIRAKRILSIENRTARDTSTTTYAYENVRIWSTKFSAVSDSSRYIDSTQTFELWSDAKAWHEQVQLTGPYIRVLLNDGDIEKLVSYPSPFAVQEDTVLNRLNQIKGDTLTAFFTDGDLRQIHIIGNSHILRYTKDEQGRPDGAIDMTAPQTRIFFEDGELVELKSVGNIDGSYLPENEQTSNRKLDGFSWNPELRPERPRQQMAPRFPPIPEARPFELPRRYREYIRSKTRPSVIGNQ